MNMHYNTEIQLLQALHVTCIKETFLAEFVLTELLFAFFCKSKVVDLQK